VRVDCRGTGCVGSGVVEAGIVEARIVERTRRPGTADARLCALLILAILGPISAGAQSSAQDEAELEDVIDVQELGREVLAFDALTGATLRAPLEFGETVHWLQARGRVALALTDRRALAASAGGGGFQELRWRVSELPPEHGHLGDRVALAVTGQRLLGFESRGGRWIEQALGPGESLEAVRVGARTALVVSNRNAFGLSPAAADFRLLPLQVHERFEAAQASAHVATVTTDRRLLVFKATTGGWSVQNRPLR
jgi:hypothetical protein